MTPQQKSASVLVDAWQRLESVCRKLWDENSTAAVEAQAVFEEFKGEVQRVNNLLLKLDEQRENDHRESEDAAGALRRQYEMQLASLKKRLELEEQSRHANEKRIEDLLKTLAVKEEQNLEFHSQILRVSAASDETKTKKMEEFYQELMKKEAALADSWQQRRTTLEQEHEHLQKILDVKQNELTAWEKRHLTDEESLKKRSTDLEIKSQQLAQEYRKKQQEIEDLKAGLQRSITDLVRQYQSRLRGSEPLPTTQQP